MRVELFSLVEVIMGDKTSNFMVSSDVHIYNMLIICRVSINVWYTVHMVAKLCRI